jgi:hypothetical protein
MNTDAEEFFEATLNQAGHLAALLTQLLNGVGACEINPSVIDSLKTQFLKHDAALIAKLGIAEQNIRDVQHMIDQWAAAARARLQ